MEKGVGGRPGAAASEESLRQLAAERDRLADRVRTLERDEEARAAVDPALRESEEKFRAAFHTSPDAINLNRMDGVYVEINEGFTQLTGYTREDVLGVSSRDLVIWAIPRDRERLIEGLTSQGMVENLESDFRCKDGSLKTALMSARVIQVKGEPHILSVTRDITERKRADEALRASEARYRMLVEQAVDGILLGSTDGTIIGANSRMLEMLCRGREEVLGQHIKALFRAESLAASPLRFDLLLQGHTVTSERDLLLPDGSTLPIEMHTKRMEDGTYQAIVRDISARKRAERALRESEARFRTVVESAAGVIFVLDPEGMFQLSEGLALARLGLAPGEVVGESVFEVYRGRPEVLEPVRRALAGEAVHGTIRTADLVFDTHFSPLRDHQGQPAGVLGVATDITDRVRAEESRLELERQLLHAQKLESLGVMAGGIAHDFNNLLMAILGNVELALNRLPDGSPAKRCLDLAVRASLRAADLTRQMLAYSGKGAFAVTPVDLSALVTENAHLLRAALSKNVTLRLDLNQELPPIRGDLAQLQQVTMNLITNASEAVGDQAGTVHLVTEARELDASTLRDSRMDESPGPGRFVCLEVTDTGCGMDTQTEQQLFDPFFTTKFTGRGLGMAAVLGIVKGHGGAIFTASAPGRGTTVRVLFPVAEELNQATATPALAAETGRRRCSGTVLLVDDEAVVREACAALLAELGVRVLVAEDGPQAVRLYRERVAEIDAVLLDLTMPRMDGMACFRELRAIRPDVKVLLTSGFSEDDVAQRFDTLGLAAVIQKPYSLARLAGEIARVLGGGAETG